MGSGVTSESEETATWSLSPEGSSSETIDTSREGGDEGHHIGDKFLLWCPLFLLHESDESDTIVLKDAL